MTRWPRFDGGRIAVNVVDMPIKCPVAPLEFCFLADWYFRKRGIRDRVELTFVTPLDGAFTKPVASRELGGLLKDKGIELVTEFNTGEVDGDGGRLVSFDGREVGFDLAVVVPAHGGQAYVSRSPGLGDALGFVPADERTLQSKASPDIFVIGDAADLRASKAGSVAHFEGEVLVRNIRSFLAGKPLAGSYDGHANCFIESGFGKALLIDFNYDTEPLAGRFPGPSRPAAAEGVPPEPPGQARLPAVLLARAAARPGRAGPGYRDAARGQTVSCRGGCRDRADRITTRRITGG